MASPTRFPAGVSTQAIGSTLGQFPFPDPTDICLDFHDFNEYVAGDWTVTNTTTHQTIGLVAGAGGLISPFFFELLEDELEELFFLITGGLISGFFTSITGGLISGFFTSM